MPAIFKSIISWLDDNIKAVRGTVGMPTNFELKLSTDTTEVENWYQKFGNVSILGALLQGSAHKK